MPNLNLVPMPNGPNETDAASDAVEALIALGYQSSEAARMVGSISPLPEKTDEIIRMALKGMLK